VGSATGSWPLMKGAPSGRFTPEEKSYDSNRRKYAAYLGIDCIFTAQSFCQTVQTVAETKVLVNSTKNGDILAVRRVPDHVLEKPWFKRKLRFPREYVGIPQVQKRVEKLSYLVHILAQGGIPSRRVWKGLKRLSLIWYHAKFDDMRKHIHCLTQEVIRSQGLTRSPWMPKKRAYPKHPVFTGEKVHSSGIHCPLWTFVT